MFKKVLTVVTLLGAVTPFAKAADSKDEAGVRAFEARATSALRRSDWAALYFMKSSLSRQSCSYADYMALGRGRESHFRYSGVKPEDIQQRDLRVRVFGDHAVITFTMTVNDVPIAVADDQNPLVLVYENGSWFNDNEGLPGC